MHVFVMTLLLLFVTEGYVEFENQCTGSCPNGFQTVGKTCEQCIDLCDKGEG